MSDEATKEHQMYYICASRLSNCYALFYLLLVFNHVKFIIMLLSTQLEALL